LKTRQRIESGRKKKKTRTKREKIKQPKGRLGGKEEKRAVEKNQKGLDGGPRQNNQPGGSVKKKNKEMKKFAIWGREWGDVDHGLDNTDYGGVQKNTGQRGGVQN